VVLQLAFIKRGLMEVKKNLDLPDNISKLNAGDKIQVDCKFTINDLPPGMYKIGICSVTGILYDTYNSNFREARVND
jgi:hypothetical protein